MVGNGCIIKGYLGTYDWRGGGEDMEMMEMGRMIVGLTG